MYGYLTRNKGLYAAYSVFLLIASVTSVMIAFLMGELINCAVEKDTERLFRVLVFTIVFLVFGIGCEVVFNYLQNRLLRRARYLLKEDVFSAAMYRMPLAFEKEGSAAYLNDLQNTLTIYEERYFKNVLQIPYVVLQLILAVAVCCYVEVRMLLIIVPLGFVMMAVMKKAGAVMEQSTVKFAGAQGGYVSELQDDFRAHRLIRAYGAFSDILRKHARANEELEKAKEKSSNDRVIFMHAMEFTGLASTYLIMGAAAFFAIRGIMSAGFVMTFGHLSSKIISPISSASQTAANLRAARPLTERYRELLERSERGKEQPLPTDVSEIELQNATVAVGDKTLLAPFTRLFSSGKKTLVMGESGCGKSTLLHLIAGLYDEYDGSVRYGGVEQRDIDVSGLSRYISLVSQEAVLFQASLRDNVTVFSADYTDDQVEAALKAAGLEDFLAAHPEGLDLMIDENGIHLSGGERQRINLARALLCDHPVLLLDEISASLDPETTRGIEERILSLTGKTVISVAHKMPEEFVMRYDEVLRMES